MKVFLPFLVNILGLGFTAAQPLMTKPHVHASHINSLHFVVIVIKSKKMI